MNYFVEHGFESGERLEFWLKEIRRSAEQSLIPESVLQEQLQNTFRGAYHRLIEKGGIAKYHKGVGQFTIQRVSPRLRSELDRRIMASAKLIKLNRRSAIEKTVQRFSGWATSIPAGGSETIDRRETKEDIRKALASLPFEERRVAIDQGHKFISSLSNILATDGGAIAVKWNDHGHWDKRYNARPEHMERDGKVYLLKDNWAQMRGLVKPGPVGYYEDVTSFGEEVFCRCFGTYLYALRDLPNEMLTAKGRSELERVRAA